MSTAPVVDANTDDTQVTPVARGPLKKRKAEVVDYTNWPSKKLPCRFSVDTDYADAANMLDGDLTISDFYGLKRSLLLLVSKGADCLKNCYSAFSSEKSGYVTNSKKEDLDKLKGDTLHLLENGCDDLQNVNSAFPSHEEDLDELKLDTLHLVEKGFDDLKRVNSAFQLENPQEEQNIESKVGSATVAKVGLDKFGLSPSKIATLKQEDFMLSPSALFEFTENEHISKEVRVEFRESLRKIKKEPRYDSNGNLLKTYTSYGSNGNPLKSHMGLTLLEKLQMFSDNKHISQKLLDIIRSAPGSSNVVIAGKEAKNKAAIEETDQALRLRFLNGYADQSDNDDKPPYAVVAYTCHFAD